MKIEKETLLNSSAQQIWDLLLDPTIMGECVPGMQSIEVITPDEYVSTMVVKISFITAKFKIRTFVVDKNPPYYLMSKGAGEDSSIASTISQTSEIFLDSLGENLTKLGMKVNVDVLGRIGSFGLSAMKTKADRLWDEFVRNLNVKVLKVRV